MSISDLVIFGNLLLDTRRLVSQAYQNTFISLAEMQQKCQDEIPKSSQDIYTDGDDPSISVSLKGWVDITKLRENHPGEGAITALSTFSYGACGTFSCIEFVGRSGFAYLAGNNVIRFCVLEIGKEPAVEEYFLFVHRNNLGVDRTAQAILQNFSSMATNLHSNQCNLQTAQQIKNKTGGGAGQVINILERIDPLALSAVIFGDSNMKKFGLKAIVYEVVGDLSNSKMTKCDGSIDLYRSTADEIASRVHNFCKS